MGWRPMGWRSKTALVLGVAVAAAASLGSNARAQTAASLYEVAHIHVDFTASDAVAAQKRAMADAQSRAIQIVLRRLVPSSAYAQLPKLTPQEIDNLVEGVSIENDKYSTTRYIANLDISFNEQAVNQMLQGYGLTVSDERAPPIVILPVTIDDGRVTGQGDEAWQSAWESQDLAHALAPAELVAPPPSLDLTGLNTILAGDVDAYNALQQQYGKDPLVIAVIQRSRDPKSGDVLETRLFGNDAVGNIDYTHQDPVTGNDLQEAASEAASFEFGLIEDRWKAMPQQPQQASLQQAAPQGQSAEATSGYDQNNAIGDDTGAQPPAQGGVTPRNVVADVQFQGLAGWQNIHSKLAALPGVQDLEVNSLSPDEASITFDYAGTLGTLQKQLAQNGLVFESNANGFLLHAQ
jgi:Uncharacterized protein conserved in bacteria (DUF2066)